MQNMTDFVLIPGFSFLAALLHGSLVLRADVTNGLIEVWTVFILHLHVDLTVADLALQVGNIL